LLGTLEPGVRGSNLEVAQREIRKVVLSVTAGDYSPAERGIHVRDSDFGARNGRALIVGYGPADSRRSDLRVCADSATKNKRKDCEQRNDYSRIAEQFFCIQKSNLHSFTPSRKYLREKREHEIRMENKLPRIHGPFHPIAFKKEPNP
jgi:hypothetical protein